MNIYDFFMIIYDFFMIQKKSLFSDMKIYDFFYENLCFFFEKI